MPFVEGESLRGVIHRDIKPENILLLGAATLGVGSRRNIDLVY
jgi:hypothetical protein